jgi:hypothetical protein
VPRPVPEVALSARAYQRQSGIHVAPSAAASNSVITERASRAIGDAYGRLPSFDAGALPAYRAMREETGRQFDHMTKPRSKGGLGLDVEITKGDPYGSDGDINKIFSELHHDVRENNRIQALSTKTTGGHPFFSNDENDMFRAVHDVYGHLGSGRGVDHNGEEAAFQKHAQMFSPLARQAMATETRGQNSHLRLHGDFPEQKVALLPQHMQGLQFNRTGSAAEIRDAHRLARSRSADQGIR